MNDVQKEWIYPAVLSKTQHQKRNSLKITFSEDELFLQRKKQIAETRRELIDVRPIQSRFTNSAALLLLAFIRLVRLEISLVDPLSPSTPKCVGAFHNKMRQIYPSQKCGVSEIHCFVQLLTMAMVVWPHGVAETNRDFFR